MPFSKSVLLILTFCEAAIRLPKDGTSVSSHFSAIEKCSVHLGSVSLAPAGSRVVLGLPDGSRGARALPPEQAVAWPTLRPGSGRLSVVLSCAGPTRIVVIKDTENPVSINLVWTRTV